MVRLCRVIVAAVVAAALVILLSGCNRGVTQRADAGLATASGTAKSTLFQGDKAYTAVTSEDLTASDFTPDGTAVLSPSPMTIATFGPSGVSLADPKNTTVKGLSVKLWDETGQERASIEADEFGGDNATVIAARATVVSAFLPIFLDAGATQREEIKATIERIKAMDPIVAGMLEAALPLIGIPPP